MTVDELIEDLQKISDFGGGGLTVKYPSGVRGFGWEVIEFVNEFGARDFGNLYVGLE